MNKRNRLGPGLAGGLVFIAISAIFQTVFSEDPSYLAAVLGGVVFAVTWVVVSRVIDRRR